MKHIGLNCLYSKALGRETRQAGRCYGTECIKHELPIVAQVYNKGGDLRGWVVRLLIYAEYFLQRQSIE